MTNQPINAYAMTDDEVFAIQEARSQKSIRDLDQWINKVAAGQYQPTLHDIETRIDFKPPTGHSDDVGCGMFKNYIKGLRVKMRRGINTDTRIPSMPDNAQVILVEININEILETYVVVRLAKVAEVFWVDGSSGILIEIKKLQCQSKYEATRICVRDFVKRVLMFD